jgi:fatty acid desaturase
VASNVVFLVAPFAADKKYWEFDRPSAALVASLNPRYRRLIRAEAAAAIAVHAALLWGLAVPPMTYAAMYLAFGFTWSAMQYVHHFGTERHVTRGARNLRLFGPLDLLWMNHNWHRVHHEHPTVPWTHLPALADGGPRARRGFLPLAYLRMWRGPRRATERVANKYAGRVIR